MSPFSLATEGLWSVRGQSASRSQSHLSKRVHVSFRRITKGSVHHALPLRLCVHGCFRLTCDGLWSQLASLVTGYRLFPVCVLHDNSHCMISFVTDRAVKMKPAVSPQSRRRKILNFPAKKGATLRGQWSLKICRAHFIWVISCRGKEGSSRDVGWDPGFGWGSTAERSGSKTKKSNEEMSNFIHQNPPKVEYSETFDCRFGSFLCWNWWCRQKHQNVFAWWQWRTRTANSVDEPTLYHCPREVGRRIVLHLDPCYFFHIWRCHCTLSWQSISGWWELLCTVVFSTLADVSL